MKGWVVMTEPILQMKQICKIYDKTPVVDNFDMSVEKGHIYGLIGPNGAGKTTIMKMLAGLAMPDSGEMIFFGETKGLHEQRRRMSFMIETPIIDTGMTARENMHYVRYVRGIADEKRIEEVLEFVGLGDTGKKVAQKFSLGMKQRLGIGIALLSNPEILVLDEPVNGLDPEGIVDVRKMLKKLSKEQSVTIIISSHLLTELTELCTDFTLINHGKLIESFSAEELLLKCSNHICIKTNDINKTSAILEDKLAIHNYKVINGNEIHLFERLDDIEIISKTITDSGLILTKLTSEGENLEQYYLSKVGGLNE